MKNFAEIGLCDELNASLKKMNYDIPTPIQAEAIPLALLGHDILGSAQTGTGKTAAFSIPLVERVIQNPQAAALIMTPTRELAKQVLDVIHQLLGHKSRIKTAFIIGGESMGKQLNQLRARPQIIVGTPGRINDHLQRGSMDLDNTDFLVLDETDRMLDMGFGVQLDKIVAYLPKQRQTLMFSATMPAAIVKLSEKYLNKPERISMGATNVVATNIKQEVVQIEQGKKYEELMSQLHERTGSVIVFIKTKHAADRMAKNLRRDGFTSDALHGDLKQNKRDKVMKNFRDMNFRVLIATDIAARGLDVPHIEHVINYDLPQVAEDYIHRMGRTARAGATGSALSFVASQDIKKWRAIEVLLDPRVAANDEYPSEKKSSGKPRRSRGGAGGGYKGKGGAQGGFKGKPQGDFKGKPKKKFQGKAEGAASEGKSFAKPKGKFDPNKKSGGKKPYGAKPGGKIFGKPSGQKQGHKSSGKKVA